MLLGNVEDQSILSLIGSQTGRSCLLILCRKTWRKVLRTMSNPSSVVASLLYWQRITTDGSTLQPSDAEILELRRQKFVFERVKARYSGPNHSIVPSSTPLDNKHLFNCQQRFIQQTLEAGNGGCRRMQGIARCSLALTSGMGYIQLFWECSGLFFRPRRMISDSTDRRAGVVIISIQSVVCKISPMHVLHKLSETLDNP